jgi:hypothetical protein
MKRQRQFGLRVTSQAERDAIKEGMEAKRIGQPKISPYLNANGEVIPMFRNLHRAWLNGYGTEDHG